VRQIIAERLIVLVQR